MPTLGQVLIAYGCLIAMCAIMGVAFGLWARWDRWHKINQYNRGVR
jgi:hypothetical protein